MKEITYMTDFVAMRLLWLAEEQAARFGECLEDCEAGPDRVMRIDAPGVLPRLMGLRMSELLLALTAFEAYLGYYSAETARRIEAEQPGIKLAEFLEQLDLLTLFKKQSAHFRRRHELIMEENGRHSLSRFLTGAQLMLMEKFIYWPMIRTKKILDTKDGYVKKIIRLIRLRDELAAPALEATHDLRPARTAEEIAAVMLHHPAPAGVTPGVSCSDRFAAETYAEEHFMWELLHCYPARVVREGIQYLHHLDRTPPHLISVMKPALLVDGDGKPATAPATQYVLEFGLED